LQHVLLSDLKQVVTVRWTSRAPTSRKAAKLRSIAEPPARIGFSAGVGSGMRRCATSAEARVAEYCGPFPRRLTVCRSRKLRGPLMAIRIVSIVVDEDPTPTRLRAALEESRADRVPDPASSMPTRRNRSCEKIRVPGNFIHVAMTNIVFRAPTWFLRARRTISSEIIHADNASFRHRVRKGRRSSHPAPHPTSRHCLPRQLHRSRTGRVMGKCLLPSLRRGLVQPAIEFFTQRLLSRVPTSW